jgi:arginyl-tRNA--protein-N-Asp/Glu arginylyltransferase
MCALQDFTITRKLRSVLKKVASSASTHKSFSAQPESLILKRFNKGYASIKTGRISDVRRQAFKQMFDTVFVTNLFVNISYECPSAHCSGNLLRTRVQVV